MAIQKIPVAVFIEMAKQSLVLDVRSPGEYLHAHIPGAISLPLFTDEERKVVGTAYKQESRQKAIKIGLDYFGVKMKDMVEAVEELLKERASASEKNILLHCWRGGMRSAGVAWLLDLYGFKVFTLSGGYKAYREWARIQFEKPHPFRIIGGYTGSGKTLLLHQLQKQGIPAIDLEGLAHHKGSAFGSLGEKKQPTQEMFENLLATSLHNIYLQSPSTSGQIPFSIFIEDESQRIGLLQIPNPLWQCMRTSPISFLDIPFEERLHFLTTVYGKFTKEELVNAIIRIQKKLGGLETKTAINFLLENNHRECFRILLQYYDKLYNKGLHNRENLSSLLNKITCANVDAIANTNMLLHEKSTAL